MKYVTNFPLLSFLTVVVIISLTQVAQAEEIYNEFYGLDNLFQDPNSIVKLYKSGGFSLKNYDLGIAVFAHPIDNTEMFKFTVLFDGKISRFLIDSSSIADEIISTVIVNSAIIEPKSSIGADITRFDIPTTTSRDNVRDPRIIVYLDNVSIIMLNEQYTPNIKIEDQDFHKIPADINVKITRDGITIKDISDSTKTGVLSPVINILDDYFTPGFCYTITVTATAGNYTDTVQDDFSVFSTAKYWDSSADPIDADSHCND